MRDYIIVFIAANEARMKKWCTENGKSFTEETMSDEGLRAVVYEDLCKLANANQFTALEKPG